MLNNVNYDIDITKEPPADDTARQYYFIEKAKAYVQRESEELGRPQNRACQSEWQAV